MLPFDPDSDAKIVPFPAAPGDAIGGGPAAGAAVVAALMVVANSAVELVKFAAAIGLILLAGLGLGTLIR